MVFQLRWASHGGEGRRGEEGVREARVQLLGWKMHQVVEGIHYSTRFVWCV